VTSPRLAIHPGSGITEKRSRPGPGIPGAPRGSDAGGRVKPSPAHRLDRETSGVVVVAKTARHGPPHRDVHGRRGRQDVPRASRRAGSSRRAAASTCALAEAPADLRLEAAAGSQPPGGAHPLKKLAGGPEATLLEVTSRPDARTRFPAPTCRRSHPVVGDTKYGDFPFNASRSANGCHGACFCTAARLELAHPLTKKRLIFESPLPQELADCLPRAGSDGKHRRPERAFSGRPAHLQLARK